MNHIKCLAPQKVLYVNSMTVDSVQQLQRHKESYTNILLFSFCHSSHREQPHGKGSPLKVFPSKTINLFRQLVPQQWCAFLGFCWYPPAVPVCRYCLNTGLQIKSMLLSEPFLSELYNNTLTMCDIVPTFSVICGSFLHDIFMAITLSFNKEFLIQRLCQHGGLC
ncbi:zinc finger protein [Schistosoma japonicum]|nr:zinc finger protein [Schistosoma japonicum]